MKKRIDIHHHLIPEQYVKLLATLGIKGTPAVDFPAWSPKKALKVMNRNDIGTAILSISTPGTHFKDDAFSRKLTRMTNQNSAELIDQYPGRFGAFAALPLPDLEGALIELDYALDTLGLDGVGLLSNYEGISTMPVWLMNAATLGIKIFNRHQGALLAFFLTAMTSDVVAPRFGNRHLQAHFRELVGVS